MGIEDDDDLRRRNAPGPVVAEARDALPDDGVRWPWARGAPAGARAARSPVDDRALHAVLALPASQEHIRAVIRARVNPRTPEAVVDELVQEANLAALEAKSPPRSMATVRGWIGAVTLRTVQTHFRRSEVRRRYIQDDVDVDAQPAVDGGPDAPADGWLSADWLASLLATSPRDAETFELLAHKASTGASHDSIAAAHGMTAAAWKSRVHDFRAKYAPQRRRRQAMFILWWVAAAVVVSAAIAWLLARNHPPAVPAVVPTLPSASAAPVPEPEPPERFRQASPPPQPLHLDGKPPRR